MGQKAEQRAMEKSREKQRNRRAEFFTIAGLAAAFGSWGYFVLAANPSFYFGISLMGLCALCLIIAARELLDSRKALIINALLIVGGFFWVASWSRSQWILKVKQDMEIHLDIKLNLPPDRNLWKSLAVLENESSWPLKHHHVECEINELRSGNLVVSKVGTGYTWGDNLPLRIGGDSRSDRCLYGWWSTQGENPIRCADVIVSVAYTVDSKPEISGSKALRFVTDGKEWIREPVESSNSMCQ